MTDPISVGASAVTIADRALAAFGWLKQRIVGRPSGSGLPGETHGGLELRPLVYQIDLTGSLPNIRVEFLAINYLRRPIELREVKISSVAGTGHPSLGGVDLDREVTIPARSSFAVFCSRALADTEARGSRSTPGLPILGGSVAFVARGWIGRREIRYGPVAAKVIRGSILDPPASNG